VRRPDLIIGPKEAPQTLRWHLFRWRGFQIALHRWVRSDNDRALHDHTAGNISILLTGRYLEVFSHSWEPLCWKLRRRFVPYYRKADTPHRVFLHEGPIWTLWIRFAPWRQWGFYCPKGWRHWRQYTDERDMGLVGRGCDD
jgi:hypothetical protein